MMASALSSLQFSEPGLFAALLVLSVISSALKVDMPLGAGGSCISLSYVVDFTALLLFGPGPTMLIAMASGWSQCTLRMKERNPPYKTLFSMATLVVSVAAAGATYTWLGGTYGTLPAAPLQPLMAAAMIYFLVNSLAVAAAFGLSSTQSVFRVWHDNFLWTHQQLCRRIDRCRHRCGTVARAGQWQTPLAFDSAVPDLSNLSHLPPSHCRRAAAGCRVERSCTATAPRCSHGRFKPKTRAAAVMWSGCSITRRHWRAGSTCPISIDKRSRSAALLHDIGKLAVPEHILSKPGPLTPDERKKMQMHAQIGAEIVGAVPFPCPVAPLIRSHHERWDGIGLSVRTAAANRSRSARASSRSSTASTRSPRSGRTGPPSQRTRRSRVLRAEAGKAFDPAIVAHSQQLVPVLTPPTNDGFLRRMRRRRSGEPSAIACQRSGAIQRRRVRRRSLRQTARTTRCMKSPSRWDGASSLTETMTLVSCEAQRARAVLDVCAVRAARGRRFALPVRDRPARRPARECVDRGRQRIEWVGGAPSQAAGQRPAQRRSSTAAGLPTADIQLQSALICPLTVGDEVIGTHRRVPSTTPNRTRKTTAACSIRWPARRRQCVHNALVFERTQEQAFKDALTGLANPRALQFQVARELGRARRTSYSVLAHSAGSRRLQNHQR